jgi:hypothetical protein
MSATNLTVIINSTAIESNKITCLLIGFIILVGTFGNGLNMLVFSRESMRKISTFRFLFYLSVIDLLVLLICGGDFMLTSARLYIVRLHSLLACKLHTYVTYWLTQMSSVCLSLVSIDRVLVVTNRSMRRRKHVSRLKCFKLNRMEQVLVLLGFALAILNIHFVFFLELELMTSPTSNQTMMFESIGSSLDSFSAMNRSRYEFELRILDPIVDSVFMCYPNEKSNYFWWLGHVWVHTNFIKRKLFTFCSFFFAKIF